MFSIITAAAILALVILGPLVGLWPLIRPAKRAHNNALLAFMDPPDARRYVREDDRRQSHPGVTGQEVAEVSLGQLVAALFVLGLAIAFGPAAAASLEAVQSPAGSAVLQIVGTVVLWAAFAWLRLIAFRAWTDRVGHAVEIRMAANDPKYIWLLSTYLKREVGRMRLDLMHADWTQAELENHMRGKVGSGLVRLLVLWIGGRAHAYSASKRSV